MKKTALFILTGLTLASCAFFKKNGVNVFTIDQDKQLGAQVAQQIASDPAQYPIVDSVSNSALYTYMYKVRNKILNSGKVQHKNDFPWQVRIINNDTVLNAFCTPGGYIYVYTGILKYLDSEDELAGVLGHEIAHADLRHSTRQMTTMYGVDALLQMIAGKSDLIKTAASNLASLKFSRDHESQADEMSVEYLCPTDYPANAGGKFFQKLIAAGQGKTIQFLSDHPSPENRVETFNNTAKNLGCKGTNTHAAEYAAMKKLLNNIKAPGTKQENNGGALFQIHNGSRP